MAMNNRLLRPRASGGFLPSTISGLEIWLDASKASSVTLNGSNVSEWRDRRASSSAKVAQTVAAQQPTWSAASRNALGGVNFPAGTNLTTAIAGYSFSFAQPTTYFMVFQAPTTDASWAPFDGDNSRQHVFGNAGTEMRMFAGSAPVIATLALSQWYIAVLTFNGASSTHRISTKTASTTDAGSSSIDALRLGSGAGLRGDMNEFGMFSKVLSDAESGSIIDYLANKWAITLS